MTKNSYLSELSFKNFVFSFEILDSLEVSGESVVQGLEFFFLVGSLGDKLGTDRSSQVFEI